MHEITTKCGCYDATEATAALFPRDKLDWRSEACEFFREMIFYQFKSRLLPKEGKCFCPICKRIICDGCIDRMADDGIESFWV